jgi:hypothetical protein
MEILAKEQSHITESDRVADGILGMALETQGALERQRQSMGGTRSKLGGFGAMVRGAAATMTRIKWKKRKNMVITGTIIALCAFFLFWWWISSS